MTSSDHLAEFLLADTSRRDELIFDEAYVPDLRSYLGDAGLAEYRELARVKPAHLGLGREPNLLFVPGVMGSVLMNERLGGIWWVDVRTRRHLDDLGLSPDGSVDADPESSMRAIAADSSYEPFFRAVIGSGDPGSGSGSATFLHESFAYDWRKPLTLMADAFAEKVLAMRAQNGGERVHLVGHSMGGLLIRTALWKRPDLWDEIDRVVFIGTPHYGSPAIIGYLKNHFWGFELLTLLGRYLTRRTLRSMWGVLSLLPAPSGVYPGTQPGQDHWSDFHDDGHPAANFDFYDVDAYGFDDISNEEQERLQTILTWVSEFHTELADAHGALIQPQRDRMLTIAGIGQETLFRLEHDRVLRVWEHWKKVTDRRPGDPHREGDGRVPVASAQLPDTELRYVPGVHGGLTNIEAVWTDVFRFLAGDDLLLPASFTDARHLGSGGDPVAPALDGTSLTPSVAGDPGYLLDISLTEERFDELDQALERGDSSEFARVRIL